MLPNMPWKWHCRRFGSTLFKFCAPREFLNIISFSAAERLSFSTLVTLSSMTPPKRISLQCGSERLSLRLSNRPVAKLLELSPYLVHTALPHRALDTPECLSYPR